MRHIAAGPFPRRGDGGAQAFQHRHNPTRLFSARRTPSKSHYPANGGGSQFAGAHCYLSHRARAGRSGPESAQPVFGRRSTAAGTVLFQSLQDASERVASGERNAAVLLEAIRARIAATRGSRLDYASVVDAASLKPVARLQGNRV